MIRPGACILRITMSELPGRRLRVRVQTSAEEADAVRAMIVALTLLLLLREIVTGSHSGSREPPADTRPGAG